MSQKDDILHALKSGEKLTCLDILMRFRCMTGAQRVSELRKLGHDIKDELVPNVPGGKKKVSLYWMEVNQ